MATDGASGPAATVTQKLAIMIAEYSDASPSELSGGVALAMRHQRRIANALEEQGGERRTSSSSQVIATFSRTDQAIQAGLALQAILLDERQADTARSGMSGRFAIAHGEVTLDQAAVRGELVQKLRRSLTSLPLNAVGVTEALLGELPEGVKPSEKAHGAGGPKVLALHSLRTGSNALPDTQMAPPTLSADAEVFSDLQIIVRGQRTSIGAAQCPWIIGRDENSHTVLVGGMASRQHGRIEFAEGRFYYVDESVNGSYVLTGTGNEIHLHNDRFLLLGNGAISPGIPLSEQKSEVIRFECRPSRLGIKSDDDPQPSTRRLR